MKMIFQKLRAGILLTVAFLALSAGILCMTEGFREGGERLLMRRMGIHTKQVEKLYALKVSDSSDTQGIEALLHQVIDEVFLYEGMDGNTEPFTVSAEGGLLKIQYNININRPDSFQKLTGDYSAIILALVPDIRQIEWNYTEIQRGTFQPKTVQYDWKMMQKKDFIDSDIYRITKKSAARDFGSSVSNLQYLIEHSAYYEKGKLPDQKKPAIKINTKSIQKELMALPDSYVKATECETIYVNKISTAFQKDYNRKIWNGFYKKTKKGEPASIIIGNYNSMENATPEQTGSVYYSYVCYDGKSYRIWYDFVSADGAHDFDKEAAQGKYLLKSTYQNNDASFDMYFLTDDASVSWQDVLYSNIYSGANTFTPAEPVNASEIVSIAQ